jgi:hypothetical protein
MTAAAIGESVEVGLDPAGVVQYLTGMTCQHFARQGRLDPPSSTFEELEIERLLKTPQARTYGRHDDIVLTSGGCQTTAVDRSQEYA